jgi:hypothetical protein
VPPNPEPLEDAMKMLPAALLLALAAVAVAELPKPAPVTRYAQLWTESPFTTKPPVEGPAAEVNPLEDYALGGVSPITGGYRVTLLNRKNPEERIVLPDNTEFRVLDVQYAAGNPLLTTVRLSTGSKTGTVSFDEKLLVLKAAPAPQPQQNPQNPPGIVPQAPMPGQPQGDPQIRQPRPRVVPPAPTGGAAPQPQPQVNPQGQNQRPSGQQRLNRR